MLSPRAFAGRFSFVFLLLIPVLPHFVANPHSASLAPLACFESAAGARPQGSADQAAPSAGALPTNCSRLAAWAAFRSWTSLTASPVGLVSSSVCVSQLASALQMSEVPPIAAVPGARSSGQGAGERRGGQELAVPCSLPHGRGIIGAGSALRKLALKVGTEWQTSWPAQPSN